jgi:ubiquilin
MMGMGGMGGGMGGLGGMGGFGGLGGGLGGAGLGSGLGAGQSTNVPANTNLKELYKSQLEQLQNMGFTNENFNLDALKATAGNVEAAVERLLNMLN